MKVLMNSFEKQLKWQCNSIRYNKKITSSIKHASASKNLLTDCCSQKPMARRIKFVDNRTFKYHF